MKTGKIMEIVISFHFAERAKYYKKKKIYYTNIKNCVYWQL
jgi:hypothetical protein